MSTKAEWAELFESVHGRKPSPQEFLDAKAADFDTSALAAQAASVEAPANEPVAEEVAPEPVATEEVTEQDDIADVAETAEDAVAEQASSESPFGAEAFSEAPVQQPTPQFDSSMFEKAPISSAQGFGTVPNPAAAGSADKPLFNLILPIVAIALSVIFAVLAWFVRPFKGLQANSGDNGGPWCFIASFMPYSFSSHFRRRRNKCNNMMNG